MGQTAAGRSAGAFWRAAGVSVPACGAAADCAGNGDDGGRIAASAMLRDAEKRRGAYGGEDDLREGAENCPCNGALVWRKRESINSPEMHADSACDK